MHSHAPLVQLQRRAAAKRDPQATSPAAAGGEPHSARPPQTRRTGLWQEQPLSNHLGSLTACSVYQSPAAGDTIVAYEAHNVTWDCACVGTDVAGKSHIQKGQSGKERVSQAHPVQTAQKSTLRSI